MKLLALAMLVLLIPFAIADISCSQNSITTNYKQGSPHSTLINCANTGNETVTLNKGGESSLFTISESLIGGGSSKNINISFSTSASLGLHSGTLQFSDNTSSLPIFFTVEEIPQDTSCKLTVFPTVLTNIKITQGETKTRNVQLSVPPCYTGDVTVNGVSLQSDEKPIQMGETQLGTLKPGNSVIIPIEIDAKGVSTGTYQDSLSFLVYDKNGNVVNLPSVTISVTATSGIQPINNFSFTQLPTCSINSVELSLNQSYKLTCTISNPNIVIEPLIDDFFINGESVDETGTQYIYTFKPINIGETKVGAKFLYKTSSIGSPYVQDVRISPSGNSPVAGTSLRFDFFQEDTKKNVDQLIPGEVNVVIIDTKTNSAVNYNKIIMNGKNINDTFTIESNKLYELRAGANGYVDTVLNFTVEPIPIPFDITPVQTEYRVGDVITFNSTIPNVTFLVDNVVSIPPYTLVYSGILSIEARKDNYNTTTKNLTVLASLGYKALSSPTEEWKDGNSITVELFSDEPWVVQKDGTTINNGTGKVVNFEIDGDGTYSILADGVTILTYNLDTPSILSRFSNLSWTWWAVIIGIATLVTALFVFNKRSGGIDEVTRYT
jgi:hypothetical protein